ncbi:hypothetical protein H0H92_001522 [Tricholoma furcatifolium]|nr:hypothetical protein H0H92_001522 [Tricholoma furcatifolium]
MSFTPTPTSIPPPNPGLRLRQPNDGPVHLHPLNPLDFLLRAAQIYPDKVALVHSDVEHPVSYTFSVWAQRVQNLAYALIEAGIQPGDRVAVIAPNSPMIAGIITHLNPDAHHGVIAARAIITPINTRLKPQEVAYILQHSGARLILVDYEYTHLIKGTKIPFIVSNDTGRSGDPYESFLASGRKFSGERGWSGLDAHTNEDAPSAIANAFEGQMNRHSTYLWSASSGISLTVTYRIQDFTHVSCFGLDIPVVKCIRIHNTVNYSHIWKHLLHSGVTHYCGAPTVQIGIVNDPLARKPPQAVKAIIAGAAPTPHLIAGLETLGITPVHVYGLTNYEQDSWSKLTLEERSKLMARQGNAFATAQDVRVVYQPGEHAKEDELIDVPRDGKTLGEVVTRGNITMKEYFNDPEATAKAFRGGAFRSGDLAVWYPDGSIAIMDRSKDIIISGGENASSLAIEQELATHPHILEVTVVARQHVKWGERPMAFVVLHPQHAAKWAGRHAQFAQDLKAHAKSRLPGFACPEWVEVVPDLPKTSTGKILKTELRKMVAKL